MATDPPWSESPLAGFCESMAEGPSGAAGARAAALLVAAGAGLAAGAQRGHPEAAGAVYARGRADELDALRERTMEQLEVQRDVLAKLTAATEDGDLDKWRRRWIELALEPLELAVAALRIAAVGAPETEGESATDLAAGATLLAAAAPAVGPEFRRSLEQLSDPEWCARHRMAAEALEVEAKALLAEVRRETNAFGGGSSS